MVAYPPEDELLDIEPLVLERTKWGELDTVMADALSKTARFGVLEPGEVSELSGHQVRIVGTFSLGVNSKPTATSS